MHTDEWRVVPKQYSCAVVMRGTDGDDLEIVAKAYSIEAGTDVEVANLIAAAPELLAALRAAKDELISLYEQLHPDDESDNETTAAIDGALAAISKAEGRGE